MSTVCRCDYPYIGTQMAGEPIRCERCGGLVDEVARARVETRDAEERARARLLRRIRGLGPMTGFWDRLGVDEAGMPVHLPMAFDGEGLGPAVDEGEAEFFGCWCSDQNCLLNKVLRQASELHK